MTGPAVRLRFAPIGRPGERYPAWVRALQGYSGVYVIRAFDGVGWPIVYVGESHHDRLYGTLTRHFQHWHRYINRERPFSRHDPGLWYPRDGVTVAALVTDADDAIPIQYRLIRRLRPRDNLVEGVASHPDDDTSTAPPFPGDRTNDTDEVPF